VDVFALVAQLAARQGGLVTTRQLAALGLQSGQVSRLCASGRWQRVSRGIYLVDARPALARSARIKAAVQSFGPGAVAVLGTAAELHGIAGLPATELVHVSVPHTAPRAQRRTDPGIAVHQLVLSPGVRTRVGGVPVTTAVRTVADVMLCADRYEAVSVLDSALNQELLTHDDMVSLPGLLRGRRGAVAAVRHLREADARSQSPLETRVRLQCVDAHIRPDTLQHEVRDADGSLIGIGDLAWVRARVIVEADGHAYHSSPEAVFRDRRRQNRFLNAGWTVLRFTWADTMRPEYVPRIVHDAVTGRRARWSA